MPSITDPQITSLKELLHLLDHASLDEMGNLLRRAVITPKDLEPICHWDNNCYTRTCIFKSEKMEVLLLSWKAGQETEIHNHGGQKCWVHQMMGSITEKKYLVNEKKTLEEISQITISKGECSYIDDNMGVHSLHNYSKEKSVSLHLYIKPIQECMIYKDTEEDFLKEMSYDYLNLIPCEQ